MIALELFGCSGGMAEGFRRAGLTFTFAFDRDPDACTSYAANLGHRPIRLDVRDLVRMAAAGWSPGPVDLLVADPPCAPWSRAGKRKGLDDERDMLVETCELIRHLRPKSFLIGNVPGLDDGPAIASLRRTIGALGRLGYCVDYQRLDAANYGVPQHRHRPFWFGHLAGACVRWPAPTHGAPELCAALHLPGMAPLRPWVTCREALAHLPVEELGRPVKLRWKPYDIAKGGHRPSREDAPARTITRNTNGDGALLTNAKHPVNRLDSPSFAVTTKGDGRGAQGACVLTLVEPPKRPPSTKGPQSGRIGRADEPGRTLNAHPANVGAGDHVVLSRPGLAPPGHHDESFAVMSLPEAIVLSEKAAAILQGFPETWTFAGKTKASRWAQIGMAMPPPLAEAVARSVLSALGSG